MYVSLPRLFFSGIAHDDIKTFEIFLRLLLDRKELRLVPTNVAREKDGHRHQVGQEVLLSQIS